MGFIHTLLRSTFLYIHVSTFQGCIYVCHLFNLDIVLSPHTYSFAQDKQCTQWTYSDIFKYVYALCLCCRTVGGDSQVLPVYSTLGNWAGIHVGLAMALSDILLDSLSQLNYPKLLFPIGFSIINLFGFALVNTFDSVLCWLSLLRSRQSVLGTITSFDL